jgi:hypothetical protein
MANELTASQERELKKDANSLLRKLHEKPGRNLGHLVEGTGNYEIRKSDGERAIASLHRGHVTGADRTLPALSR